LTFTAMKSLTFNAEAVSNHIVKWLYDYATKEIVD